MHCRRLLAGAMLGVVVVMGACSGGTTEQQAVESLESSQMAAATLAAQSTARYMALGDFATAEQSFSAALRAALPPAELQASWASATGSLGQFVSIGKVVTTSQGDVTLFTVPVTFSGGSTNIRMHFDRQVQIVDLAIG